MDMYLFRCSIEYRPWESIDKLPVYVVSSSKENARAYVEQYLRKGKVKNVACLGKQLGTNMFHGK